MKIRGWHIDGFGHFHDHRESDLPDGITVFLGPNEAGKSTLLAFLRGMLFGFPTGKGQNRYEPLHTRHMGGKLLIDTPQGKYTLGRNGDRKEGFKLYRPDDSQGSESELAQLLGHADQGLFKSVFAFSLSELQNFGVHKEAGIKDRIFAGSLQGGRNTAREALTQLDKEYSPIFKARGRENELIKLSRQLEVLQAGIQEARNRAQDYETLKSQAATLTETLARLTLEQAAHLREIQRHQTLLDLWPKWLARGALQQELDALEVVEAFPPQAEPRHAEAQSVLKGLESALTELQLEHQELVQRRNEIIPDDRLAALAERIPGIAADAPLFLDWVQGLAANAEKRNHAQGELDAALASLGPHWTRERLDSFDSSIPALDEVLAWQALLERAEGALSESSRDVKDSQQRADAARLAVEDQQRRLSSGGDAPSPEGFAGQEARLVRLRTNYTLQKEAQTEQRQLEETIRTLEIEQRRAPSSEPIALPRGLRAGLWEVAALLVALAGWNGLSQDWLVAALLGILAAVLAGLSFLKGRVAGGDHEARKYIAEQLRQARAEQDALRSRLEALIAGLRADAEAAGLSAQPSPAEIEAFARKLDEDRDFAKTRIALRQELERLAELERETRSRLERAIRAQEAAAQDSAQAADDWRTWRLGAGIDEDRSPKGVGMLFQALVSARQFLAALMALEATGDALAQKADGYRQQAIALLADAGEPVPMGDTQLVHGVGGLQERLASDLEARLEHANRSRELTTLEFKLEAKREELSKARQALASLYAEAGAEDEGSFHRRMGVHGKLQDLQRSLLEADRFLDEHFGRDAQADALKAMLLTERVESWKQAITEAQVAQDALVTSRDETNQLLGQLRDELRKIEEASDVISREHAYQAKLDEFRRQTWGWLVRAIAEDMIQETLSEVERTRQPAVISQASRLFRQVTDERYVRLVQHEGDFLVVDQRESRKEVGKLSQGTAEQLYLCLRLGLIREFARQSANLPLIMDDVFVNFDPERARSLAKLLVEFASEHQVLLFTCHPQTAALLQEVQPDVRLVTMPRYGGHGEAAIERSVERTVERKVASRPQQEA